jgi:DNA-binding transcriptional regulator LsrR (DeoR family)
MTKNRGKRDVYARRRKEMARLYVQEGLTLRAIADIMGIVHQSVHAALRREGIQMRPRGGYIRRHTR